MQTDETETVAAGTDKSTNYLKWVLLGFCLVAVVLVVLIIINRNNNENLVSFGDTVPPTDCSDVMKLDDSGGVINCIGLIYNEGREKEAMSLFDKRIDKAVEEKDGFLAADLIVGRSQILMLGNRCGLAVKYLDDKRVDSLETSEKTYFYDGAADLCDTCDNAEQRDIYIKKMEVLDETEEVLYVYD